MGIAFETTIWEQKKRQSRHKWPLRSCPLSWKRISSLFAADSIWNTMIIAAAMKHNGIIES